MKVNARSCHKLSLGTTPTPEAVIAVDIPRVLEQLTPHLISTLTMLVVLVFAPACAQSDDLTRPEAPQGAIWVDSLDLRAMGQGWGMPMAGRSVEGKPLKLKGVVYAHGVGTHSPSELTIDLKGVATRFESMVGVDDERTGMGSVAFEVWVDGQKKADTEVLRGGDDPKLITVDLIGAKKLVLIVTDAGDNINDDHADWAGAMLLMAPGATEHPVTVKVPDEPTIPMASGVPDEPAIHGPRIVGATPGRWFQFMIPATGKGPLAFSAKGLPAGLTLDAKTGIIRGPIEKEGISIVELVVSSPLGSATRKLMIDVGEGKLAQTPPLGWNSWNVWAGAIDDKKVRAAADWMVKSGLAAHGFQYINIDDCWEGRRDANGEITTNEKFPDMKALADYVHSKGLKLGIYSGPGPKTCAGFEASYQHEQQDANTWARWGIDYLKYDWCSYGEIAKDGSLPELQKPYRVMGEALKRCGRDIVYSLCQYGMGDVWEWGAEVGGNCWRTTGDIGDSWGSLSSIAFSQDGHEKHAGPGHWNDPDMLVVGKVGWGPTLHATHLTHNEQILHITMWCLLSSPLLIGCDLADMDQFTIDILTNDEVLDVNQDPLGKPAGRKSTDELAEVWARPLWDGTIAAGLFNRGSIKTDVTAKWSDLGIPGSQPVRDLWQKKDLGSFYGSFTASVPAHGALMIKIGKPNRTDW